MWQCPRCGEATTSNDILTCWACLYERMPEGADWEPAEETREQEPWKQAAPLDDEAAPADEEAPAPAATPDQPFIPGAFIPAMLPAAGPRELEPDPETLDCLRCGGPLAKAGTNSSQARERWGFSSHFVVTIASNREIETWVCDRCGKIEFFAAKVGREYRPAE